MASVRKKGLYEEEDRVEEFILNQAARLNMNMNEVVILCKMWLFHWLYETRVIVQQGQVNKTVLYE